MPEQAENENAAARDASAAAARGWTRQQSARLRQTAGGSDASQGEHGKADVREAGVVDQGSSKGVGARNNERGAKGGLSGVSSSEEEACLLAEEGEVKGLEYEVGMIVGLAEGSLAMGVRFA